MRMWRLAWRRCCEWPGSGSQREAARRTGSCHLSWSRAPLRERARVVVAAAVVTRNLIERLKNNLILYNRKPWHRLYARRFAPHLAAREPGAGVALRFPVLSIPWTLSRSMGGIWGVLRIQIPLVPISIQESGVWRRPHQAPRSQIWRNIKTGCPV